LEPYLPLTILADLFDKLSKNPFKFPKIGFVVLMLELGENFEAYNDSTHRCHEAGYDAYMTGLSFARMIR
jgi:hypothetical protein